MSKVCYLEQIAKEVEIMIGKYQRKILLVDEIEIQTLLLRSKIADIIQDEFAREMNRLVYEEARRCCEGCEMGDPSQMHHDCMMKEEEEIWICHYQEAKNHFKIDKAWSAIEGQIHKKIRCLSGGLMVEIFISPCESG